MHAPAAGQPAPAPDLCRGRSRRPAWHAPALPARAARRAGAQRRRALVRARRELWLYRGAWAEWELDEIDLAVPLSPQEVLRRRRAIFRHETQKDQALFLGDDRREFWQRTEDRSRRLAEAYNALGLAEYEAIEAFKRYAPRNSSAMDNSKPGRMLPPPCCGWRRCLRSAPVPRSRLSAQPRLPHPWNST